jgi:putative PIN family toxin of toxin-antitoxin system
MKPDLLVVFDTNVLMSTIMVHGGVPQRAFLKALQHGRIAQSLSTLNELRTVLERKKFDKYVSREERNLFLTNMVLESVLVIIHEQIAICRDPKDDKFLELAVNADANIIITGYEDLLALHPFRNIPILNPSAFVDMTL